MKHRAWTMLIVTATVLATVPALAAFRCPAADTSAAADKPTLSSDDMAEHDGTVSATLKSAIHRMQAEGMKSGEIVDRLVVTDCSHVESEPNVSDGDKAKQVRRFASRLANFIYTAPGHNEEDIVVDVPVPTSVYEQLKQAAKKASMSEDAWVNQAIKDRLAAH